MIFFDHSNDGDVVSRHAQVPGIFQVTEVTDGALPVFHSRTDASGYCDMREGHIRCKVINNSGEYMIVYRIIQQTEHIVTGGSAAPELTPTPEQAK
jgi:hypothetical protein